MTYEIELSESLAATLKKLARKDKALATAAGKKIRQIASCDDSEISHYKNLRSPMNHLKRVHVGSFVLTFQIKGGTAVFEDLTHHDNAYD